MTCHGATCSNLVNTLLLQFSFLCQIARHLPAGSGRSEGSRHADQDDLSTIEGEAAQNHTIVDEKDTLLPLLWGSPKASHIKANQPHFPHFLRFRVRIFSIFRVFRAFALWVSSNP